MASYWEPWQPQIGQRVRVLPRPECFYCREEGGQEVGAIGVVTSVDDHNRGSNEPGSEAHVYWVEADEFPCGLSHFAAGELEPAD